MMNPISQVATDDLRTNSHPDMHFQETSILKQQLVREITCLERQLERIRMRDANTDETTLVTYEEMIECRRKMLHNLPWQN